MKVFDSIIFFNELELLEMRLNILNDVVDYFVVTESPFTVSGNEKPLYYAAVSYTHLTLPTKRIV